MGAAFHGYLVEELYSLVLEYVLDAQRRFDTALRQPRLADVQRVLASSGNLGNRAPVEIEFDLTRQIRAMRAAAACGVREVGATPISVLMQQFAPDVGASGPLATLKQGSTNRLDISRDHANKHLLAQPSRRDSATIHASRIGHLWEQSWSACPALFYLEPVSPR